MHDPLRVSDMHVICIHPCRKITPAHKMNKYLKIVKEDWQMKRLLCKDQTYLSCVALFVQTGPAVIIYVAVWFVSGSTYFIMLLSIINFSMVCLANPALISACLDESGCIYMDVLMDRLP